MYVRGGLLVRHHDVRAWGLALDGSVACNNDDNMFASCAPRACARSPVDHREQLFIEQLAKDTINQQTPAVLKAVREEWRAASLMRLSFVRVAVVVLLLDLFVFRRPFFRPGCANISTRVPLAL
jgi:hypothetical protein